METTHLGSFAPDSKAAGGSPLGVRPGAQRQPGAQQRPWKEALLTFTKTTKRSGQSLPTQKTQGRGGMGTGGSQGQAPWSSPGGRTGTFGRCWGGEHSSRPLALSGRDGITTPATDPSRGLTARTALKCEHRASPGNKSNLGARHHRSDPPISGLVALSQLGGQHQPRPDAL